MDIVQIISQHKKIGRAWKVTEGKWYRQAAPLKPGFKRVEAIVRHKGFLETRHIDIPKD
jgi:hypothetical protein